MSDVSNGSSVAGLRTLIEVLANLSFGLFRPAEQSV